MRYLPIVLLLAIAACDSGDESSITISWEIAVVPKEDGQPVSGVYYIIQIGQEGNGYTVTGYTGDAGTIGGRDTIEGGCAYFEGIAVFILNGFAFQSIEVKSTERHQSWTVQV